MKRKPKDQMLSICDPSVAIEPLTKDRIQAISRFNTRSLSEFLDNHKGWGMTSMVWRLNNGTPLIEFDDHPFVWLDVVSGEPDGSQVLKVTLGGNRVSHGFRTNPGSAPSMTVKFFDYYGNLLFEVGMDSFDVACTNNINYASTRRVTNELFSRVYKPETHGGSFLPQKC